MCHHCCTIELVSCSKQDEWKKCISQKAVDPKKYRYTDSLAHTQRNSEEGGCTESAFCQVVLPKARLWEGRNGWSLCMEETLRDAPWCKGISNCRLAQNLKVAPNQQNWKSLWYCWSQSLQGSQEKPLRGASEKQYWGKNKETGAQPRKIIALHHRNIIQSMLWKKFCLEGK